MPFFTTRDGTEIFYKDWGPRDAQPIFFHHGWPLSSDDWDNQLMFFLNEGFRVIAHDRRGHGRSTQTDTGNDMDTYADDLAALIEQLDLQGAALFGFSTGGGEVARYIGRHGTRRLAKAGRKLGIAVEPVARGRDGKFLPAGICWVVERSFSWISNYRRLNTIFERTKEHLVAFIEIAFVSILSRRIKRLVAEEVCA